MQRGCGIFHLSLKDSEKNFINDFDGGRFIQQSYYGNDDGSEWPGAGEGGKSRPWKWNPVQGTCYDNTPSRVNKWGSTSTCFRSFVTPRHWATCALLEDVALEQTVCLLSGNHATIVKCHFTMVYNGTTKHDSTHHEMPAIFLHSSLNVLKAYTGNAPWTNDTLSDITPPKQSEAIKNSYQKVTECWAAYVGSDNTGVGVLFPGTTDITMYVYAVDGNEHASCSYFAPIRTYGLTPGQKVEYDFYIAIGALDDIRKWFSDINNA